MKETSEQKTERGKKGKKERREGKGREECKKVVNLLIFLSAQIAS